MHGGHAADIGRRGGTKVHSPPAAAPADTRRCARRGAARTGDPPERRTVDLATIIPICLKASIALAVLGLGLRATVGEATSLLRAPSQLGRAAAAMLIVVPVFAMFVARAL